MKIVSHLLVILSFTLLTGCVTIEKESKHAKTFYVSTNDLRASQRAEESVAAFGKYPWHLRIVADRPVRVICMIGIGDGKTRSDEVTADFRDLFPATPTGGLRHLSYPTNRKFAYSCDLCHGA